MVKTKNANKRKYVIIYLFHLSISIRVRVSNVYINIRVLNQYLYNITGTLYKHDSKSKRSVISRRISGY